VEAVVEVVMAYSLEETRRESETRRRRHEHLVRGVSEIIVLLGCWWIGVMTGCLGTLAWQRWWGG
jgi:hypothetical protein